MIDCVYANARAIALENTLLGVDRLNRMIDCTCKEDALKILSEVNFGDGMQASDFESLILVEEKKLIDFLFEVAPSENLKKYLIIGNDYHNAEVFLRCKYLKIDPTPMLTAEGLLDLDKLKEDIFSDDYKSLNKNLSKALLDADALFALDKPDGRTISAIFKKALYNELYEISIKEKVLKELFSIKADAVNISIALRIRDYSDAVNFFVNGGNLTKDDLKYFCEESAETLKEKFKFSKIKELVESALDDSSKNQPLVEFEKLSDGYALKYLKENKYAIDGYLPFMRYCFYKRAEISNVRIIISCIDNGIDKSQIKLRVRETYEG